MARSKSKNVRIRKYLVSPYQKEALRYLQPPEDISISEWAEKYRVLDSKGSANPGPWRNDKTPYLVGVMDELRNYETEEIIFVKPTQVGGTEALLNMLGWVIQQDPSPSMAVYPSDTLAESLVVNRLRPMIYASSGLKSRYRENDSSKSELQFDGMYLNMVGSNSPSQLASKPIRFLFLDEVDKYPGASKKEADPIKLARERTKTFHNRKIYITSTPTLRTGHIWQALESADLEKHYFVPCPHCGEYIELKFSQIKFPDEPGMSYADRAEFANYICQQCGCIITDQHKPQMLRYGEWRIVKENTRYARKVAFWINTLYSPFVRFSEVAKEFLTTKDDPEQFQNFTNSWLAEPWENTKLKTSADLVRERQTDLEMYELPSWTKLLTGGVDVQENCIYWTIRAWGDYLTSQNIAHGQALGWSEIVKVMNLEYRLPDGNPLVVDLCLVDSGDQTDSVYEFCSQNSDWAIPCKGSSKTLLGYYNVSTVNKTDSKAFGMKLIIVDGGKYKDMISGRMRKPNGTGSWMVYRGVDADYCEQVTSEHKVVERNSSGGQGVPKWKPKHSHAANHYLDCEVYATAAADLCHVRELFLQNQEQEKEEAPAPPHQEAFAEESWINQNESWM
ncbi:MAG: phage terminase large subunit family protein [Faecalibacterium sp.]